jgi:homoserine dehydrogenase
LHLLFFTHACRSLAPEAPAFHFAVVVSIFSLWICRGLDLSKWRELLEAEGEPTDMVKFMVHVKDNHFIPNAVIIDCTASAHVAEQYYKWLKKGIHIITPNKKANSGPLDQYLCLRELQRQSYTHYFYEATVGAGLPIISTLRGLNETGDKIIKIEGIFRYLQLQSCITEYDLYTLNHSYK